MALATSYSVGATQGARENLENVLIELYFCLSKKHVFFEHVIVYFLLVINIVYNNILK